MEKASDGFEDGFNVFSPKTRAAGVVVSCGDAGEKTESRTRLRLVVIGEDCSMMILGHIGGISSVEVVVGASFVEGMLFGRFDVSYLDHRDAKRSRLHVISTITIVRYEWVCMSGRLLIYVP